jgi:hypothetical protein
MSGKVEKFIESEPLVQKWQRKIKSPRTRVGYAGMLRQ